MGWFNSPYEALGDIDVSAIAKTFNGGGHRNAAGFQLDLIHGRIVIDRILGRLITMEPLPVDDIARSSGGCIK